eukprot:2474671-Rhodomonas_salina.1
MADEDDKSAPTALRDGDFFWMRHDPVSLRNSPGPVVSAPGWARERATLDRCAGFERRPVGYRLNARGGESCLRCAGLLAEAGEGRVCECREKAVFRESSAMKLDAIHVLL